MSLIIRATPILLTCLLACNSNPGGGTGIGTGPGAGGGGGGDSLTVVQTTPANLAVDVSRSTAISATFSRAIDSTTVTAQSFLLGTAGGLPVTGQVQVSGATATFQPAGSLDSSTQYTASLAGTITDTDGVALGVGFAWTFTTAQ